MKELRGTKTEKNLKEAFAGESQAKTKYEYFAAKARKMAMNKLLQSLKRLQSTKKHTQRCGLSILKEAKLNQLQRI